MSLKIPSLIIGVCIIISVFTVFKNTEKPSEIDSAQVKITDMTTGYYDAHNVVHEDNPYNKFD